ncbi:MAG: prolyl oligopeptidase family serine peptidase [Acidobacteriia bacterium]|nr:prolyl oligopeptidase family serine peptidase [Terriglobia bacterium]
MKMLRRMIVFALLLAPAFPQSLPNLPLVRLGYTVKKRTTKLDGDLKEKIDANDRALNDATRNGNIGEVRRLIAKGMVLLNGGEWTDQLDYNSSLALRPDHAFVDTSKTYAVRIEQIYMPSIALEKPLSAHATLRKFAGGRGNATGEVVKDLGTFEDVSRDLREAPYRMELDLSTVADGSYSVHVDVMDGSRVLGSANTRIAAKKNLDASLAALEHEAQSAPESIRADVLYPADYVKNVDRGRFDIGTFDIAKELAEAGDIAKSGKDPFAGRTGDFKRHYFFTEAGEIMPYHLYVPTGYNGSKAFPLIVALHGLGGNEDGMLRPNYQMVEPAEKRGYIVVAPMGYRLDGFYGSPLGTDKRRAALSEQDVMHVLDIVRKNYKIDPDRTYLMGHSMGAIGTWAVGTKHPEIWAALGPISGVADPRTVASMRNIPEVVVHGDADTTVPVSGSRNMVAEMKRLGVDVKYIEVPGGSHTSVPGPNMAAIFDFFDTHKRSAGAGSGQR